MRKCMSKCMKSDYEWKCLCVTAFGSSANNGNYRFIHGNSMSRFIQAASSSAFVEGVVPVPATNDMASNSSSSLSHHVNLHQVVSKSETVASDSSRQRIPSGSKVNAGQSLDLLIQVRKRRSMESMGRTEKAIQRPYDLSTGS